MKVYVLTHHVQWQDYSIELITADKEKADNLAKGYNEIYDIDDDTKTWAEVAEYTLEQVSEFMADIDKED